MSVDATQLFLVETTASDADSDERLGNYSVIRLVGIDDPCSARPSSSGWELRVVSM